MYFYFTRYLHMTMVDRMMLLPHVDQPGSTTSIMKSWLQNLNHQTSKHLGISGKDKLLQSAQQDSLLTFFFFLYSSLLSAFIHPSMIYNCSSYAGSRGGGSSWTSDRLLSSWAQTTGVSGRFYPDSPLPTIWGAISSGTLVDTDPLPSLYLPNCLQT